MFAPEGRPFIVATALPAAAAWVAAFWTGAPLAVTAAGLLTLLALFVAFFFRDPPRAVPADAGAVLAPAHGRVIEIVEVDEPEFFQGRCRRISIFLSVFDVHVQTAPVSGPVAHRTYHPGGYAVAWHPKASEENERAGLGIETVSGKVLVRQIAGLVARRIVTDFEVGDQVTRGHRIGIIRFGSRVDTFIPLEWPVTCSVGDRTRSGETIIARVPGSEARKVPIAERRSATAEWLAPSPSGA
ncbi:MAG: phosphatidylserine decarboxylase family protein [Longimicrobiales bacterium]